MVGVWLLVFCFLIVGLTIACEALFYQDEQQEPL